MRRIGVWMTIIGLWVAGSAWAGEEPVGMIKTLEGEASVNRQGDKLSARVGTYLYEGDTVITSQSASLGFILKDNTVMTLGPDSELEISQFLFAPAEEDLSLVVRMLKGTAIFLTGMIGKLAPEAVRIETPDATIGIRGTHFAIDVT